MSRPSHEETVARSISSVRRSRGQYATRATRAVERLQKEVEKAERNADSITAGEVLALESLIEDTIQSVGKYEDAVTKCQDLEDVDEVNQAKDEHFKKMMDAEFLVNDLKMAIWRIRGNFDRNNIVNVGSMSSRGFNAPRINTSLKPPELMIDTPLTEFKVWRTKFKDYFNANKMSNLSHEDQKAYLRACLAVDTINTMDMYMEVTENMSVNEQLDKLEDYFRSSVSIVRRRFEFHRCQQEQGESFSDFFVRLKILGSVAELDNISYEDQLATRVVLAIRDPELQRELLQNDVLTVEDVKKKCQAWESGNTNQKALQGGAKISKITSSNHPNKSASRDKGVKIRKQRCGRCGSKENHPKDKCWAIGKKCNKCGKQDHLSNVCHSQLHEKKKEDCKDIKTSAIKVKLAQMGNDTPTARVKIWDDFGNMFETNILPDTGATEAVASYDLLRRVGIDIDKKKIRNITAANGTNMRCFGCVNLTVQWLDHVAKITAYVSPDVREIFLGWQNLIDLNIIPWCFPYSLEDVGKMEAMKTNKWNRNDQIKIAEMKEKEDPNEVKDKLVKKYSDVFDSTNSFKAMDGPPMRIYLKDMTDVQPTHVTTVRPIAYHLRESTKAELDYMDKMGVTEDAEGPTEWVSPFMAVDKPGGGVRIVVDYSHLNKYVLRPTHPFPSVSDITTSIPSNSKWFAKLDATKGYWQVELDEKSKKMTTFLTPWGRKWFKRAPMGLCSSGDEYCQRGDKALAGIPMVLKVVDDILCFSETLEELVKTLEVVLERCRQCNITLAPKKFTIAQEISFVGLRIGGDGIRPDPEKLKSLREFPVPTNIKELRSFFGLANQLAMFTPEFAQASVGLRGLLSSKNVFQWLEEHQKSFDYTKEVLLSPQILAHFDPKLETQLHTDASCLKGLGFALLQNHGNQNNPTWKIVSCGSRFLSDAESGYAVCELEMLAIQWAVKKCHVYLAGMPYFVVVTDHKPLIPIVNKFSLATIDNPRLRRLKEKLAPYVFTLTWKKGSTHYVADALSRAPVNDPEEPDDDEEKSLREIICYNMKAEGEHDSSFTFIDKSLDKLREEIEKDENYKWTMKALQMGKALKDLSEAHPANLLAKYWSRMSIHDGLIILDGHRIFVPKGARKEILEKLHGSHQGICRTRTRARSLFYWPGISNNVAQMIKACEICQVYKPSQTKEPLMSEIAASRPFQSVSIDLFEYGGKFFIACVDRYSGWPNMDEYRKCPTTSEVVRSLRKIFTEHGIPQKIMSDGGRQFESREFREFCNNFQIEPVISSAYHPQSNGHAEAAVKTLKALVKKNWKTNSLDRESFDLALLEWRNTPRSDGISPAQWLTGRTQRTLLPACNSVYDPLVESDFLRGREKREVAKDKAKKQYDKNARKLPQLKVGDQCRMQDPKSSMWQQIVEIVKIRKGGRSYVVKGTSGQTFLRNRKYLRPVWDDEDNQD